MFGFVRTFAFTTMRTQPDELNNLIVSCMRCSFDIITGCSVWMGSRTDEELLSIVRIGKHYTVAMLVKIAIITV